MITLADKESARKLCADLTQLPDSAFVAVMVAVSERSCALSEMDFDEDIHAVLLEINKRPEN